MNATIPNNEVKVGDTYRLRVGERYRVWKCVGDFLGATGHENLIGLMALDVNNGSAHGKEQDIVFVPRAIFFAAELERC